MGTMRTLKYLPSYLRDWEEVRSAITEQTRQALEADIQRLADDGLSNADWTATGMSNVCSELKLIYKKAPGELHLVRLVRSSENS